METNYAICSGLILATPRGIVYCVGGSTAPPVLYSPYSVAPFDTRYAPRVLYLLLFVLNVVVKPVTSLESLEISSSASQILRTCHSKALHSRVHSYVP